MWLRVIAFGLGALLLQGVATLPDPAWGLAAFAVSLVLGRWRRLRLLPWLLAGFVWALLQAGYLLAQRLPLDQEGQDIQVVGTVVGLPRTLTINPMPGKKSERQERRRTRFEFIIEQAAGWDNPGRVRLSWYRDAPELIPGQRWSLRLRMKQPRGFANPGGFDYAGWLFRNGITATGYVRRSVDNQVLGTAGFTGRLDRWRWSVTTMIAQRPGADTINGLLRALAVGDRGGISPAQWRVLAATGTNHLLAISGLHIGLVAGFGFFIGRWLWSLPAFTVLRLPAPFAGAGVALLAAVVYALLAGLSLPTQRALVMVTVVMTAIVMRRRVMPSHGLALALGLVLLLDPLSVLEVGFWLSFAAVGLLLYGMGWRPREGGLWWRWGRAQWLIALGLFPLLGLLFHQVSLIAPLANLLAIPWVAFTVVPPLLLAVLVSGLSSDLAGVLLDLAAWSMGVLWQGLQWFAALPWASWHLPGLPAWIIAAALFGVLLLLAPKGLPGRRWGLVGLLPLILYVPPAPKEGEAWFTLLDVGHGLAAVVRTHRHVLLFDSGPYYSSRFDAGNAVIVPFLRENGIEQLDRVIISHGDSDHIGGLRSVRKAIPVNSLYSGVPGRVPDSRQCQAGQAWEWDGVQFTMLHPVDDDPLRGNDRSCVLRVATAGGSLLLSADIETPAEVALLGRMGERLASDVLVAPHHGSRSSSTDAFVSAVNPRFVLFPVGYRDRYHHPHDEVVERYRRRGIGAYRSPIAGAIGIHLGTAPPVRVPCRYRPGSRRYWHAVSEASDDVGAWSGCREGAE
jgi:competence protein ComEC